MVHAPTEARPRMSYEDYEAWVDAGVHSEWVDGEVTVFMPPTFRHARIVSFLHALLRFFVDQRGLGEVSAAPFEMKLRAGRSYREPDLLFVADEHLDRVETKRLIGPADLAIEVLSPDDPNRDLIEKFVEYAEAGVVEYLIVEGRDGQSGIWHYTLGPDGRYVSVPTGVDGRLRLLVLPGFWLDPAWLAADPLPSVVDCFRAIAPDAFGHGA